MMMVEFKGKLINLERIDLSEWVDGKILRIHIGGMTIDLSGDIATLVYKNLYSKRISDQV